MGAVPGTKHVITARKTHQREGREVVEDEFVEVVLVVDAELRREGIVEWTISRPRGAEVLVHLHLLTAPHRTGPRRKNQTRERKSEGDNKKRKNKQDISELDLIPGVETKKTKEANWRKETKKNRPI